MNREAMLKELKAIDLRATPTVATMDMGIQYDYMTSERAGTGFGCMGDWPVYTFNPVNKDSAKMSTISGLPAPGLFDLSE